MTGKIVEIIGVPSDIGANKQGASCGPIALRAAGINEQLHSLGLEVLDFGDLTLSSSPAHDLSPEERLNHITKLCQKLELQVFRSRSQGRIPLVLGGDHSIAVGSVSAMSRWAAENKGDLGVIWIDAHADMNTPSTSPSGNIHGMPLAILLGKGFSPLVNLGFEGAKIKPEKVALLGVRDLDYEERRVCRESGVKTFSMREIDERGLPAVMHEALTAVGQGVAGLHLSFDIDSIDPTFAPGVSTPVGGGLSCREAHLALAMIEKTGKLVAMDFVELNPLADIRQTSALLMIELIQSSLGKAII